MVQECRPSREAKVECVPCEAAESGKHHFCITFGVQTSTSASFEGCPVVRMKACCQCGRVELGRKT